MNKLQENIQIPMHLFVELLKYFFPEKFSEEGAQPTDFDRIYIRELLQERMDKWCNRYAYTKSKDKSLTDEERAQALREYVEGKNRLG